MLHIRPLQSLLALALLSTAACGSSSGSADDDSGGTAATGGATTTGGSVSKTGGSVGETGGSVGETGGTEPDAGMTDAGPVDGGEMDAAKPDVCMHTTWLDSDGDGMPNAITERTTVTSEHSETIEYDTDGDGQADRREVEILLPSGELHHRTYELPAETLVSSEDVEVNGDDQPTRRQVDADADGTYESVTLYDYYADGTLKSERVDNDSDDDGTVDAVWLQEYDAQGRPTRKLRQLDVTDPSRDREETFGYAGDVTTRSMFDGGTLRLVETTTFDAQGNALTLATDIDADGTDDMQSTYTYDDAGRVSLERYDGLPLDGEWDSETIYSYDSAGQTTEVERLRRDGERIYAQTWLYDADGRLLEKGSDNDGDGAPDSLDAYSYDAMGRPLSSVTKYGDVIGQQSRYTYDDNAGSVLYEHDTDGDGTYDESSLTVLDMYGRPLRVTEDLSNDGSPDRIVRHEYSCAP